jgi:hypothetical protein
MCASGFVSFLGCKARRVLFGSATSSLDGNGQARTVSIVPVTSTATNIGSSPYLSTL